MDWGESKRCWERKVITRGKLNFFVWKTERNYAKMFFVCLHTNTKVYL